MATTTPTGGTSADSHPRRGLPHAGFVVLAVALVGLLLLVWQWRSPRAFHDEGNVVGIYNRVGTTALLDMGSPRRGIESEVTIHAVEPQVVRGDAAVDVLVCHHDPGDTGLGAVRGRALDRDCASHEPAEGARMSVDDQLILRVRSDEPGRLVVRGIEITYSHGWRRGTQLTGQTARVRFGTRTVREFVDDQ